MSHLTTPSRSLNAITNHNACFPHPLSKSPWPSNGVSSPPYPSTRANLTPLASASPPPTSTCRRVTRSSLASPPPRRPRQSFSCPMTKLMLHYPRNRESRAWTRWRWVERRWKSLPRARRCLPVPGVHARRAARERH